MATLAELLKTKNENLTKQAESVNQETEKKEKSVKLYLDAKKRAGKVVTIIEGVQMHPQGIEDLAGKIKKSCGAGGTVKGKTIEIQGDHRKKITELLSKEGILVK